MSRKAKISPEYPLGAEPFFNYQETNLDKGRANDLAEQLRLRLRPDNYNKSYYTREWLPHLGRGSFQLYYLTRLPGSAADAPYTKRVVYRVTNPTGKGRHRLVRWDPQFLNLPSVLSTL